MCDNGFQQQELMKTVPWNTFYDEYDRRCKMNLYAMPMYQIDQKQSGR